MLLFTNTVLYSSAICRVIGILCSCDSQTWPTGSCIMWEHGAFWKSRDIITRCDYETKGSGELWHISSFSLFLSRSFLVWDHQVSLWETLAVKELSKVGKWFLPLEESSTVLCKHITKHADWVETYKVGSFSNSSGSRHLYHSEANGYVQTAACWHRCLFPSISCLPFFPCLFTKQTQRAHSFSCF